MKTSCSNAETRGPLQVVAKKGHAQPVLNCLASKPCKVTLEIVCDPLKPPFSPVFAQHHSKLYTQTSVGTHQSNNSLIVRALQN